VVEQRCVLRYDNESGKGDHRHIGDRQEPYVFRGSEALLADFWGEINRLRSKI
jgi:hypothetical protein